MQRQPQNEPIGKEKAQCMPYQADYITGKFPCRLKNSVSDGARGNHSLKISQLE